MKFTALKNNLSDALSIVAKGLSNKHNVFILNGIHLKAENNQLTLTAADPDLRIEMHIPVEVINEGETVVSGRSFVDFVRRLPDGVIEFSNVSKDGNDYMSIIYGKSQANMSGWPGREYPTLPTQQKNTGFTIKSEVFQNIINHTAFTVNPEEIRPIFTGLLFEINDQDLCVVGTDSFRLALIRDKIDNTSHENFQIVIPVRALNEVARLGGEEINISIYDKQIVFEIDNICLTCQKLRGEYPPYSRVLPDSYQTYFKIDRKLLLSTVERAMLFSKEKDGSSALSFNILDGKLEILSESEFGKVHEQLDIFQEGDHVDISFNAKFMLDALKAMKYEQVEVTLNGSLGPCIFKPVGEENYLYLLLPLRR